MSTIKYILVITFFFFIFLTRAETIRIDFVPGCPEEFDVFFKKGFESLGHKVFVNYHGRSETKPFDQLFSYEWKDHLLKISLSDKSGTLIKEDEKKIPFLDGIENIIYLMLSDLMERRVNVREYRGNIKGLLKNEMIKLDSASYILQVHNNDSAKAVSNFLQIAQELTGNFMTYYDFSYYQITYYEVGVVRADKACRLFGVVIGKPEDDKGFNILSSPPDIFQSYIENIFSNNPLPGGIPEDDSLSRVYLLRSTGFVGSFVPFSVFLDDKFICYFGNEEYILLNPEPGHHILTVQNSSKEVKTWSSSYSMEVESGQLTFIKLIQYNDIKFTLQFIYQLEKEYSARILLQNLVESKCTID